MSRHNTPKLNIHLDMSSTPSRSTATTASPPSSSSIFRSQIIGYSHVPYPPSLNFAGIRPSFIRVSGSDGDAFSWESVMTHLSMSSLGIFPSPFGPIPWWQKVFSISFGKLCMLPGKLRCGSLDSWRALDATFHSARRLCMSAMCGSWQYPHRDSFLACTSLADWHPVPLVIRPSPPQQYIALELRRNCSTSPHSPSILTTR